MPLHLAATNRRQFLTRSAAALGGMAFLQTGWGAEPTGNPHRLALLSDSHIPSTPDIEAHGVNMTTNLKQVVRELRALTDKPAGVVINGDCAYLKGLQKDYENFSECVAPLAEAGLPLHLTMGNHDDRKMLYQVMAQTQPQPALVESRHVTLLETPRINWFLLDSLMEVDVVTGYLGDQQLQWLATALDARKDKPAIVMAHHTPQFQPPQEGKVWTGMKDTSQLMEVLKSRPQVKAFVYGHSHNWEVTQQDGLHLVNLPPVAYIFSKGKPNGWVLADAQENGLRLELHTIDKQHPQHGQAINLEWRTA